MTEPVTVTYDLLEVLKGIDNKFEKIETKLEKLNTIEVKLTAVETELKGINKRLESVEGTQKNQVWALIILLASAIVTAGWRVFFAANP